MHFTLACLMILFAWAFGIGGLWFIDHHIYTVGYALLVLSLNSCICFLIVFWPLARRGPRP